ncbi:ankyrin repeat domain-containing protein 10-like [Pollicipes pollicipes]|uniref:ankyrin repeat domain-containing protein 10-like n=1 Tax=Pollicipes pollicipes TaxID=41117 RepID=UPI0018853E2B|nr:ankyrin repeat domain-containing protein 10-like [Pollicipes pollicipes]
MGKDKSHLLVEDNLYHWTPMHWASFFGQLPSLIVLREAGVAVDTTTARFRQTAAHIAAFAGSDHCLKYLIHFGCNVNAQDYLGETPLHKVARTGSVACVRALADGHALPSVHNNSGQTPAGLAAACGHPEVTRCLLQYEQFVSQQNGLGAPPPPPPTASWGPGSAAGEHGLNGGRLPARSTAATGHWCYQPPQRRPTAAGPTDSSAGSAAQTGLGHLQMDCDATGRRPDPA